MTASPRARSALDTRLPFTRADARAAGLAETWLRSRQFQKIFYDLYVAAEVTVTAELRAQAALRVAGPNAHISHHTAAELWGLPVPADSHTHVSVPDRGERCVRAGIRSHLTNVQAVVTMRGGLPVSTPVQTFLDLASVGTELVELVVVGDAMLKKRLVTVPDLLQAIDAWTGPHTQLARRAALLMRKNVDSPMETRLRLLLVFAGLPEPRVNLIVRAGDGSWLLRFDLCYEEFHLIVEYDGRWHSESPAQWERDIYRREDLDQRGLRLIVVTSRGIYREPEHTLERVRDALLAAGATGIRSQFKNEWRRHFPVSV